MERVLPVKPAGRTALGFDVQSRVAALCGQPAQIGVPDAGNVVGYALV